MKRFVVVVVATALIAGCGGHTSEDNPTPVAASTTPSPTAAAEASSAWWQIADLPTARSEAAIALFGDRQIFVIGGVGGPSRVERYDSAANSWVSAPDLPIGVVDAMAATMEGLQNNSPQGVFVFGGYLADGSATARSFRFNYSTARWEEIAPMPAPRAAAAAVAMGGSIFIVGGSGGSGLVAPTYRYDVDTQQWRSVAAIPTPRDQLAVVGDFKNSLCAIGGRQLSPPINLATFECYDPVSDVWTRLPDAPFARSRAAAVQYDGLVYVVGGEQSSGTSRELAIFDTSTNSWSRGPDLPTARQGLGVMVIPWTKDLDVTGKNLVFTPARLLAIAGAPAPGGSPSAVCEAMDLPFSPPLPPGAQIATPTH